ncbi:MAG: two-component sensor histidine kinase [Flavobacterium sp. BFFFF2]|nr:MAG: two-component sensor histidine kinase [Flavobacterium sp. BFFFF2]
MNKKFFRLLVVLMSVSLVGIVLVQTFWFHTALQNNEEQFHYHVKQVLGSLAQKLEKKEAITFYNRYNELRDSIGKLPEKEDFLEFGYYQRDSRTNETVVYSNSIIAEDYGISSSFFDKLKDSVRLKNFTSKRKTEVYRNPMVDDPRLHHSVTPDLRVERLGKLDLLESAQFQIFFKDIVALKSIEDRLSKDELAQLIRKELELYSITTPYEFCVYSNGLATKIGSDHFQFNKKSTYSIPILADNDGNNRYELMVSFPQQKKFLLSEVISIALLSIIFTLIILITYISALNQLIRQRQISEIKTDFINNMTHEFKTPIATINLALDAIKNPKVQGDSERMDRYLQMIRDENKRMHAQVENVLRISKLEKRELDIEKEPLDIHTIIEDAIEHVHLLVEDREGTIHTQLNAKNTLVLLNESHFTNVIVNILDNAIKYSVDPPVINVSTESIKDNVLIRIQDQGIGMSKAVLKKIFEKFYREHTGDIHNVKGHGLGLAYVKRIIEDHQATISVESEKGKGSTFIIKIPIIN